MMHGLEAAFQKAEYCLELAQQCPPKLKGLQSTNSKWKSIFQKLTDLYMEECAKEPKHKNLKNTSHLLEKLIAREKLNCLIVNLYPGNDGYSLMLKGRTGVETETMRLPYEETELLQCIDNEELPPILVDLLDRSQVHIFYNGCVIAEIRDYRRSNNLTTFDCHHVLLKPTLQTLLCDVNMITSDNNKWTPEDKQFLESQLLLATQEPLCLNPSPSVAILANKLQYERNKFNTVRINRTAKRNSQAALNRKRKFEQCSAPSCLQLYDFLKNRNQNKDKLPPKTTKASESWKEYSVELVKPELIEVEKYAKLIDRPKTPEHDTPILVEEYIFESEPHHGKISHTHLTIRRLPIAEVYLGELYIDKDYVEGQEKGTTYTFKFGSRDLVDGYIHQFTEIITEEGRKSVKITHMVPGQAPKVTNSQAGAQEFLGIMPQSSFTITQKPLIPTRLTIGSPNLISPPLTASPTSSSVPQVQTANRNLPRQVTILGSTASRPASASPGPPVTSPGLLPTYSQAVSTAKSAPTPPPPSNTRTPTPRSTPTPPAPTPPPRNTTPGPRRPPSTDSNFSIPVTATTAIPSNVAPLGLISGVPLNLAGILTAGGGDPNATMSLTGVPMSSGIAVPISLAMMHASQSSIMTTTPSGVIVSTIPGLMGTSALANTSHSQGSTAMTTTVSSLGTPAVIVTSGMLTSSSPVLASHTNMLPLPLGMPGTLNHLMASGLKGTPSGLRANAPPLSLLQVAGTAGQPTLSLFSQLHRPLHPSQPKQTNPGGGIQQRTVTPSPPPVTVTSPLMTTLLPQQQAILAYQKQAGGGGGQNWTQQVQQQQNTGKSKSRKRSAPASPRDGRIKDGGKK